MARACLRLSAKLYCSSTLTLVLVVASPYSLRFLMAMVLPLLLFAVVLLRVLLPVLRPLGFLLLELTSMRWTYCG